MNPIPHCMMPVSAIAPDGKTLFGMEEFPYPEGRNSSLVVGNIKDCWIDNSYRLTPDKIGDGVILDIGAAFGAFSFFAASLGATIYSFEPNHENFGCLVKNVYDNQEERIIPINLAICSDRGYKFLLSNLTGSHIMRDPPDRNALFQGCFGVDSITLSDVFLEYKLDFVDFCKMDCEASEYAIIRETPSEVLAKINHFSIECHGTYEPWEQLADEMVRKLAITHHAERIGGLVIARLN